MAEQQLWAPLGLVEKCSAHSATPTSTITPEHIRARYFIASVGHATNDDSICVFIAFILYTKNEITTLQCLNDWDEIVSAFDIEHVVLRSRILHQRDKREHHKDHTEWNTLIILINVLHPWPL